MVIGSESAGLAGGSQAFFSVLLACWLPDFGVNGIACLAVVLIVGLISSYILSDTAYLAIAYRIDLGPVHTRTTRAKVFTKRLAEGCAGR